jgi:flagellum-specific peptidoglycan hydrolase FlgJ
LLQCVFALSLLVETVILILYELNQTDTTYRNNPINAPSWKNAKLRITISLFCFIAPLYALSINHSAHSYLIQYAPLAQSLAAKTGIPASVILGIALIESGHGAGKNTRMLKNHFGVKGTNHLPSQGINYHSIYRSYRSDEASYGHFCTIIKRKGYYHSMIGNIAYKDWLLKINTGYYSSAGMLWVEKIVQAIKIHRLYKYDQPKFMLANSPKMNWLHS